MSGSDLAASLRQADLDHWLCTRLVENPDRREALAALYAVDVELAKIAVVAKSPIAGEIRLAWWREEVEAMAAGARPADHPALRALSRQAAEFRGHLQTMIEGRHAELEPRPFAEDEALLAYLDAVDGGLILAACAILEPELQPSLLQAGRCAGYMRLSRERPTWLARGGDWVPQSWNDPAASELTTHVGHMVLDKLPLVNAEIERLPVPAFPAVAALALIRPYLRGARPSELERRLRLLRAVLKGRI